MRSTSRLSPTGCRVVVESDATRGVRERARQRLVPGAVVAAERAVVGSSRVVDLVLQAGACGPAEPLLDDATPRAFGAFGVPVDEGDQIGGQSEADLELRVLGAPGLEKKLRGVPFEPPLQTPLNAALESEHPPGGRGGSQVKK